MDRYDVVIAGACLGGLSAAIHAARSGAKVLAFDPKEDLGKFACAEGVLSEHLDLAGFPPKDEWVTNVFRTVEFFSPDGKAARITAKKKRGLILDRYKFQLWLEQQALKAGVEIRKGRSAGKLDLGNGTLELLPASTGPGGRGVRAPKKEGAEKVAATTFIDATGIHCFLGRQLHPPYGKFERTDFAPVLQKTVVATGIPEDRISIWFGSPYAPEGYAWIFPKGNGVFNVGLGFQASVGKSVRIHEKLKLFMKEKCPNITKELYTVGSRLPLADPNDPPVFTKDGHHLLLVGDAARLCVATVGAGIAPALLSGKWAGVHWKEPEKYERILKDALYGTLRKAYRAKNAYISDAGMNKILGKFRRVLWLHTLFPGFFEEYAFSGMRITWRGKSKKAVRGI